LRVGVPLAHLKKRVQNQKPGTSSELNISTRRCLHAVVNQARPMLTQCKQDTCTSSNDLMSSRRDASISKSLHRLSAWTKALGLPPAHVPLDCTHEDIGPRRLRRARGIPVALLQTLHSLILLTCHALEIIIGAMSPSLLDLSAYVFPLACEAIGMPLVCR